MKNALGTKILLQGAPALTELVDQEAEESLHLEFKTLSSVNGLNRDDRKMVAKAICGFANAEGGLLIIGIETAKRNGVDVASNLRSVQNVSRLRDIVTAAIPEMLSPQNNAISVHSISSATDSDEGYLLVDVPASSDRPHMSLSEQRYFRRGSDGTRVLIHSEVRDLLFAGREGALEIGCGIRRGMSQGQVKFQLWLVLNLCNVGRIPIIAPFIRLNGVGWMIPEPLSPRAMRNNSKGRYGIYTTRDVVLHIDDEIGIAEVGTGLNFTRTGQQDVLSAIAAIKNGASHAFSMAPFSVTDRSEGDRPISVSGSFGAENAPAKEFKFHIGKMNLLELFVQQAQPG